MEWGEHQAGQRTGSYDRVNACCEKASALAKKVAGEVAVCVSPSNLLVLVGGEALFCGFGRSNWRGGKKERLRSRLVIPSPNTAGRHTAQTNAGPPLATTASRAHGGEGTRGKHKSNTARKRHSLPPRCRRSRNTRDTLYIKIVDKSHNRFRVSQRGRYHPTPSDRRACLLSDPNAQAQLLRGRGCQ